MSIGRIARRYAVAIYEAAAEKEALDAFAGDAAMIDRSLAGSRELQRFFQSPVLAGDVKLQAVEALFREKVHPVTMEFLLFLIRQHRDGLIREILQAFFSLLRKRREIQTARVTSAVPLDDAQKTRVESQLRAMTKKQVDVGYTVDAGIRGGLVLRVEDTVYDGSVARQLERIYQRLVEGTTQARS